MDINYRDVPIPDNKSPEEYSYAERRAEILQLVEQAGHPRAINQTRLADRYGCAQSNISNDMKRLREFIAENIDERTVDSITETVYQKAIQELVSNNDYEAAAKVLEKWNNWLFDRGKVSRVPDQSEIAHSAAEEGGMVELHVGTPPNTAENGSSHDDDGKDFEIVTDME